MLIQCSVLNLADLPRNIEVQATGRGARFENHPEDVVIMVKRHASDDQIGQDTKCLACFRVSLNSAVDDGHIWFL